MSALHDNEGTELMSDDVQVRDRILFTDLRQRFVRDVSLATIRVAELGNSL